MKVRVEEVVLILKVNKLLILTQDSVTTYISTFGKLAVFSPLIPAPWRKSYDFDQFKIWKCPQNITSLVKKPT